MLRCSVFSDRIMTLCSASLSPRQPLIGRHPFCVSILSSSRAQIRAALLTRPFVVAQRPDRAGAYIASDRAPPLPLSSFLLTLALPSLSFICPLFSNSYPPALPFPPFNMSSFLSPSIPFVSTLSSPSPLAYSSSCTPPANLLNNPKSTASAMTRYPSGFKCK